MAGSFLTEIDDDSTVEDVRTLLSSSEISLVVAVASFEKKCASLLEGIETLESAYTNNEVGGGCCGGPSNKPAVLVIRTDESDELEEVAIELGLSAIPSYAVFKSGNAVKTSKEDEEVTVDAVRAALEAAASASCAPSTEGCCPAPPAAGDAKSKDDILRLVSDSYAATVNKTQSCCVSVDSSLMGYTQADLLKAGADANLGLGCGNPLSFANLREGETVVDLGSGAGIDCFIAAEKVGAAGRVIGVDMTPDMVHRARDNASKKGTKNVQFRLGEIEYLPLPDDSVDCVISNCVINLSPDKAQVFRDIYRVLRQGGRIAISDVVTQPEKVIPDELKTAEALAC